MSDRFPGKPWSDNPNAPKISRYLYLDEKTDLVGIFIAAMLYGMTKIPPPHVCLSVLSLPHAF